VKLSPRVLIEPVEVNGAVALIAQNLDKRRTAFLGGWLQLPISDPQEVHLEGLDEKILGISTIRTREGQTRLHLGRSNTRM
jgi:hypothetical protein